jgi:Kef-type K+ transport system membrane component KefB
MGCAWAAGGAAEHGQILNVLLGMVVVLLAAKLGGEVTERLGQPSVLGELAAGMLLGNLDLVGITILEPLKTNGGLMLMAEIGVILLLFEVGLDSNVHELFKVGLSALLVAVIGVAVPMALGYATSMVFLPQAGWYVHLFAGATLAATSVGITARVMQDLGKTHTKESRIILGAAVVDDVLGLIILAVVSGVVTSMGNGGSAQIELGPVAWILGKSVAFLAGAIIIGRRVHLSALRLGSYFRVHGVPLVLAICYCFGLSAMAGALGLAPIVGAFAAGLVLEESDYDVFLRRGHPPVGTLIKPIATIFVPMFFVFMGLRVDLRAFGSGQVLGFAAALTAVAIIGKQACSLGVLERGVSRLAVGVGMIPRGEVGLIFTGMASLLSVGGKPVFDMGTVSAMVVMVMLTTVMTPPLLKMVFQRQAVAVA